MRVFIGISSTSTICVVDNGYKKTKNNLQKQTFVKITCQNK